MPCFNAAIPRRSTAVLSLAFLAAFWLGTCIGGRLIAQEPAPEPLHERIDRLIESSHVGPMAPLADDATFLRRAYLDLVGTIPSAGEARAFLADTSPDKRTQLIDRLLADPRNARHMAVAFDVMWMERRRDQRVKSEEWQQFLLISFQANKPYDQLVREVLSADGLDPEQRGPARFYLDRDVEPNLLTRDIGRLFFGRDLQCAQCHDHPLIDDYHQSEYYGLNAFVMRSFLFTEKKDEKKTSVAEKAEGEAKYKSVFTGVEGQAAPCLPGGKPIEEPTFAAGEEYEVKPEKDVRPVPKYSRRAALAQAVTDGTNRAFNQNIANRMWAHMMGRGLVNPVDLHHADNPPSHPELLDLLAVEIVAMKYDMRAFLRELALTKTYQRGFELPPVSDDDVRLVAEQLPGLKEAFDAATAAQEQAQATADTAREAWVAAGQSVGQLAQEVAKLQADVDAASAAADAAAQAQAESDKKRDDARQTVALLTDAAEKAAQAAQTLPEEKELAAAAEVFAARRAKQEEQLAGIEKEAADLAAIAKTTADALAAATGKTNEAKQRHAAAIAENASLETAYHEAAAALEKASASAIVARRRWTSADTFAQYQSAVSQASAAHDAVLAAESQRSQIDQRLAAIATELPQREEQLAKTTTASQTADQTRADAQRQLEEMQSKVKVVTDLLASADAASQNLPDDAELAATAKTIKARADELAAQATALAEQVAALQATADDLKGQLASLQSSVAQLTVERATLRETAASLDAQSPQLRESAQSAAAAADRALDGLSNYATSQFALASVGALTPEQFAASMMQATGVTDQQRAAAAKEWDEKNPLDEAAAADSQKQAERALQIEAALAEKQKGEVRQFVGLYGNESGQSQDDFFATADQALFLANGGQVRSWLNPSGDNLAARAERLEDPRAIAEEIYLSVLTRLPDEGEAADVAQYLEQRPDDKRTAVRDMIWALLTSAEFRFRH